MIFLITISICYLIIAVINVDIIIECHKGPFNFFTTVYCLFLWISFRSRDLVPKKVYPLEAFMASVFCTLMTRACFVASCYWNNVNLLSNGSSRANWSEIWLEIQYKSSIKPYFRISFSRCQPFQIASVCKIKILFIMGVFRWWHNHASTTRDVFQPGNGLDWSLTKQVMVIGLKTSKHKSHIAQLGWPDITYKVASLLFYLPVVFTYFICID